MRPGWVLFLDWVVGPSSVMPRTFWGLDGGLLANLPIALFVWPFRQLGQVGGWLPLAASILIAFLSMWSFAGGPVARRLPAACFYAINPIVFERGFAGQVGFLMGYALLPIATRAAMGLGQDIRAIPAAALWLAGLGLLSPHYFWIYGIILLGSVVVGGGRTAVALPMVVLVAAGIVACLWIPQVGQRFPVEVGAADLAAYRTQPFARLGVIGTLLTLYGFWRVEAPLALSLSPGWPFFIGAILLLVGVGVGRAWQDDRRRTLCLVGTAVVGLFLAAGDQGPSGSAYRALYEALPPFQVMREPQKFLVILAVSYAVFFGIGCAALVERGTGRGRGALVVVTGLLPLLYTPTLFWGFSGQVKPVEFPRSWHAAERAMGDGDGRILFLPWHQYLGFGFVGRTTVNAAASFFSRPTIVGDNVELPQLRTASRVPRSQHLESLFRRGGAQCDFGAEVAPLGVEYVVLAKTADWETFTWLDRQGDLRKVSDDRELQIFRNLRYRGPAYRQAPGAPDPAPCSGEQPVQPTGRYASPVEILAPGGPTPLVAAEPFDEGWRLGERRPTPTRYGTLLFNEAGAEGRVRLHRWPLVQLSYVTSVASAAAALALVIRWRVKRRAHESRRRAVTESPRSQ